MDLTGELLIAMPGTDDPLFSRSVVFICSHSADGAMGLILNKPARELTLREVFARVDIPTTGGPVQRPVHFGGPVETGRGFVLHRDQARLAPEPSVIPGGYLLTATKDILEDIAAGEGPEPFLFTVGYSGWGVGQLEREIVHNGWLTAPATPALVFGTDPDVLWEAALRSIGIDPVSLSSAAGRA
ncbi:YqgE/AlgH family protein [Sulfitobacter guttiformis]|uniref:UPF0301 protein C8N30_0960 n=1 Tax=Sulfitobacter guttiformis TaxID=74349 RepID=A0A420DQ98_9RHOB|nr:YqgE/AlgH family protein [Sulfitobacter guttiformis]KIN73768.1 putative transcriptional regulator [Sulfitobacter guttiformis KCTC 32187]RKE96402.1 putative transcriptional regulator [Sulfitobacter guttiformis]